VPWPFGTHALLGAISAGGASLARQVDRRGKMDQVSYGLKLPSIGNYAVIGDCRSAALISTDGAVDWLCLPRFDSPAVFAAILDADRGGAFQIVPTEPPTIARRYVGHSNVLETTFTTPTGVLRLTDLMPVDSEEAKARELWPEHEILRRLECVEGSVEVRLSFDPRFDYGRVRPTIRGQQPNLFYTEHGTGALILVTDIPVQDDPKGGVAGTASLTAGERRFVSMTYAYGMPAVIPPLGDHANDRIERSIRWWNEWASHCRYRGPYREAVMRSALVLKLLSYSPSGAIIAAPTTSLPESLGGVRNWDYRYCWLRDASLTLRALCGLGFAVEAEAFLSWLLHATHLTWPVPRVLYGVYGEPHIPERELAGLTGHRGSRPVRIGNLAAEQLQLDVYGEFAEAAFVWITAGGELNRDSRQNLIELGQAVCDRWREPDDGIWERRAGRRHHTHAKAMCWLALDRLLKLHESGHLTVPVTRFSSERDAIRTVVETRGYNRDLGTYVSVLDGGEVDASLLVLALHGYADPGSRRMRSTYEQVRGRLGVDGLLYRYVEHDGLPPGEGAFGICAFWEVQCRAMSGDLNGAITQFERLLRYSNDVGLYAEEIDPETGEPLGNFPQGLTHVGVINAALALEKAQA
jgi:GH15 family glucan-1,4-alpha-glucosidase